MEPTYTCTCNRRPQPYEQHNYVLEKKMSRINEDLIRGSHMWTFADSIAARRMYIAETDWWEAGRRTGLTMGGTWKIH